MGGSCQQALGPQPGSPRLALPVQQWRAEWHWWAHLQQGHQGQSPDTTQEQPVGRWLALLETQACAQHSVAVG